MGARKTKKQVVQRILQLLQSKPMTVNELAVAMDSNWDTVNKGLELLTSISLIETKDIEGKKIYHTKEQTELNRRKDTLFGIPINQAQENLCKLLFMKLRTRWIEKNKFPPNKTQIQKMVMIIADDLKLPDVPRGWYLFGDCCVLIYEPDAMYKYSEVNIKNLDQQINKVVDDCSKFCNTNELKKDHYEKSHNTLYLIKLKIQEILTNMVFDKTSLKTLSELLYNFVYQFPNKDDNQYIFELLNSFLAITNQLITTKNEKELSEKRYLLNDTFTALWELMATYHFFNDLAEGNYGYNRDNLQKYFDERIKTLSTISKDYLSELDSLIIRQQIIDKDSPLLKYKGIIHNVKRLTQEDRKKLFDEFNKDGSDIFREFNL